MCNLGADVRTNGDGKEQACPGADGRTSNSLVFGPGMEQSVREGSRGAERPVSKRAIVQKVGKRVTKKKRRPEKLVPHCDFLQKPSEPESLQPSPQKPHFQGIMEGVGRPTQILSGGVSSLQIALSGAQANNLVKSKRAVWDKFCGTGAPIPNPLLDPPSHHFLNEQTLALVPDMPIHSAVGNSETTLVASTASKRVDRLSLVTPPPISQSTSMAAERIEDTPGSVLEPSEGEMLPEVESLKNADKQSGSAAIGSKKQSLREHLRAAECPLSTTAKSALALSTDGKLAMAQHSITVRSSEDVLPPYCGASFISSVQQEGGSAENEIVNSGPNISSLSVGRASRSPHGSLPKGAVDEKLGAGSRELKDERANRWCRKKSSKVVGTPRVAGTKLPRVHTKGGAVIDDLHNAGKRNGQKKLFHVPKPFPVQGTGEDTGRRRDAGLLQELDPGNDPREVARSSVSSESGVVAEDCSESESNDNDSTIQVPDIKAASKELLGSRRCMEITDRANSGWSPSPGLCASGTESPSIQQLTSNKIRGAVSRRARDRERRVARVSESFNPRDWCFVRFDALEGEDQIFLWEAKFSGRKRLAACPLRGRWASYVEDHPNAKLYNGQDLSEKELEQIEGYCEILEQGPWMLKLKNSSKSRTPAPEERPTKKVKLSAKLEKLHSLSRALEPADSVAGDTEVSEGPSNIGYPQASEIFESEVIHSEVEGESAQVQGVVSTACVRGVGENQLAAFLTHLRLRLPRYRQLLPDFDRILQKANEVGGLGHLHDKLLSGSYSFQSMNLMDQLARLDTTGVMAAVPMGHSMASATELRASVSDRRLWMIGDIAVEWRNLCKSLLEYFPPATVCHVQIEEIFEKSREIFEKFEAVHKLILHEEKVLRMLHALMCEVRKRNLSGHVIWDEIDPVSHMIDASLLFGDYDNDFIFSGPCEEPQCRPCTRSLNYRDYKGHSVFSKHLSAAVLAPFIAKSGILMKRTLSNTDDQPYLSDDLEPEVCHLCSRKIQRVFEDALLCSNHAYGICGAVVCRICALQTLEYAPNQFVSARDSGKWICTHCTFACPPHSYCKRSASFVKVLSLPRPRCRIEFPFSDDQWNGLSVSLAWRRLDGLFGIYGPPFPLAKVPGKGFAAKVSLALGKYRGRLLENGEWIASFELCVCLEGSCPNCFVQRYYCCPGRAIQVQILENLEATEPQKFGERLRTLKDAEGKPLDSASSDFVVGEEAVRNKLRDGRPRLLWKVSESDEEKQVESQAVKYKCSRVSGYDWRRRKVHCHTLFVPHIVGKPLGEKTEMEVLRKQLFGSREQLSQDEWRYLDLRRKCSRWIMTGKSAIHGIGLFTLAPLGKGTFVIEYAGELVRNSVADSREAKYESEGVGTYFFRLDERRIIDATMRSSRARFLNHSCDPNLQSRIMQIAGKERIIFVARRYIAKCSELTFDYQLPIEEKKLRCLCNSWACRVYLN